MALIESEREMDTSKRTVSVLFFFFFFFSFSVISVLCFFDEFDLSSMVFLLSEIYQLINRRNMILLCHFILIFIVKDSGLLSHRKNDFSIYKENRAVPVEKEREFEEKEDRLERKEEIMESHIRKSMDIVVKEITEEVTETNGAGELEEERMERMEVMESSEEEEWDDLSEEEADNKGLVVWEVMERSGAEKKLEKEYVGLIEYNGEEKEEQEIESVEELNKKIEEFIKKIRSQMSQRVT